MVKGVRWNTSDDAKLIELFRTPHNGVDPEKTDKDSVKAVQQKYWPNRDYKSFAPLYRTKARSFCIAASLDGHRLSKY